MTPAAEPPPAPLPDGNASRRPYDVVVVGGGAAGLSAALVLGRSRRKVVVVDDAQPRNAVSGHVQGYLGHDGASPAELLAQGRREVARYGVELRTDRVDRLLTRSPEGLVDLGLAGGGTLSARRVLVATGLRDELPDVPGVAERWGRDVLHCPYCHGWEVRDAALGVLATTVEDVEKAVTMTQWSHDVVLLLHGPTSADLSAGTRDRLDALGVAVEEGPVAGLVVVDDTLTGVRMGDGRVVPRAAVVVQPTVVARDDILVQSGAETAAGPFGRFVITEDTGATGVPGVWAAGNVADPQAQVVVAAASGYRAAVAIDHDLIAEDVDLAVSAAHAPSG